MSNCVVIRKSLNSENKIKYMIIFLEREQPNIHVSYNQHSTSDVMFTVTIVNIKLEISFCCGKASMIERSTL